MLRRESFRRQAHVLKWGWGNPEETSKVKIELLDWLQPERVLSVSVVTYNQFSNYYRRNGVVLSCSMQTPALVRVTETAERSGETEVICGPLDLPLPANSRLNILWKRENAADGMQKITVTFPSADLLSYNVYPERLIYFLVNYKNEPWSEGARYYLPRPTGSGIQEYWFDTSAGCDIALRMDVDLPLGQSGLFHASDVFSIQ